MKSIVVLYICLLFSAQTHGAGKWRERIYRFLPFTAPKAYKLEKREKARLEKTVTSLSDRELVVLDLELKKHTDGIGTIEKMAQATKQEIYRRILQNGQSEILETLAPSLTAWLDNILNNEETAPQFFEIFQQAARGDLPEKYRDILQEFLLANSEKVMALEPTRKQLKGLSKATHSSETLIKILQEVLNEEKSADEFFDTFDSLAWSFPGKSYRKALNQFFAGNAETIKKLPFSPKQVKRITKYINKPETWIILLEGALERAEGDADKFLPFSTPPTGAAPLQRNAIS